MRGVDGAYNATQLVDGTLPIGDAMWDIIKGPKWAHWMFVMGEVMHANVLATLHTICLLSIY